MKQIIDVLLTDSQILNQNVEDYKKAMQFMVDKHKTLQVIKTTIVTITLKEEIRD